MLHIQRSLVRISAFIITLTFAVEGCNDSEPSTATANCEEGFYPCESTSEDGVVSVRCLKGDSKVCPIEQKGLPPKSSSCPPARPELCAWSEGVYDCINPDVLTCADCDNGESITCEKGQETALTDGGACYCK